MPPPFNTQSNTEDAHGVNETSNKVTIYFRVPYYGDKGCSLIKFCICKINSNSKKERPVTFRILYDVTKIGFFCSTIDKTPTLNQSFFVYEFICPWWSANYVGKTERILFQRDIEHAWGDKDSEWC